MTSFDNFLIEAFEKLSSTQTENFGQVSNKGFFKSLETSKHVLVNFQTAFQRKAFEKLILKWVFKKLG